MIKAVFLDIDGTIISIKKHTVPDSAREAIHRVRESGVKVFICTSRAVQFLFNIGNIENDGIVCLTGAHCVGTDGRNIHCSVMDPGDIVAGVLDADAHGRPILGLASDHIYVNIPDHPAVRFACSVGGFTPEEVACGYTPYPDFRSSDNPEALADSLGIMSLTGYFPSGAEEERVMALMPHSHTDRWCEEFVDIVANGISKADGIAQMGRHFGFDMSETMAVGDGANDISMLRAAGIGVAMGNASDKVKAAADYVTDDVDDDGLSKALARFIS